ncbi:MAG: DNRLRE domain-containing protein [Clostridia bacterium]|nr:DNRLRE domain-containing protein [Clostridia bacterium]
MCRTYIKFVIPSSVSGDITTSYIRIKKKSGDAPNVYAYPVSDTWSSGTITWKNKKGIIEGIQSTLSQHTSDGWYRLGVTEIVSMWVTGTYANYGFMLKDTRENRYSKSTVFFSSDADSPNKPELHIIYNNPVETNCVYMIKNISKGKYLSVRGNTSVVELADKDAMDGRQLWYVVANGSKYKLYSMGHRDSESYGAVESLLRGNSPGSKPKFTTPAGSYTNWEIKQDGAVFYIKNTWQSSSTALTAAYSGNAVSLVNASNAADNAKWRLEKITTSTFNNYWAGSYYINGHRVQKGEKIYIKVDLVESGDDSVYLNNVLKKSDFNIVKQWNGLSDKIVIYGPNDTVPSGVNVLHVTFKGRTKKSSAYGYTNSYDENNEAVDPDNDWHIIEVVFYVGNNNGATLYGKPKDFIERTILHEMGHVLKLAHPKVNSYIQSVYEGRGKYDSDNKVCSVMNIGKEEPNLNCSRPKWHDIINLRNKWG